METNIFQQIFNLFADVLPKKWKRLAIYCSTTGTMYGPKFYFDMRKGYVDCYNLGIDNKLVDYIFYSITKILSNERESLSANERWSVFTMFVNSKLKMEVNYSYDDIRNCYFEYKENWEKTVLKIK